jgi:hypothetical protein
MNEGRLAAANWKPHGAFAHKIAILLPRHVKIRLSEMFPPHCESQKGSADTSSGGGGVYRSVGLLVTARELSSRDGLV